MYREHARSLQLGAASYFSQTQFSMNSLWIAVTGLGHRAIDVSALGSSTFLNALQMPSHRMAIQKGSFGIRKREAVGSSSLSMTLPQTTRSARDHHGGGDLA
jgi:hypothetical protein